MVPINRPHCAAAAAGAQRSPARPTMSVGSTGYGKGHPDYLAPFNPTPAAVVERVLDELQVGAADRFVDLGCGDGRVLVAAAGRGVAQCVGVEYDPKLAARAQGRLDQLPPSTREHCSVTCGRAQDASLDDATVAFLYLLPAGLKELQERLDAFLDRGGRIASHTFSLSWREPSTVLWDRGIKTSIYIGAVEGSGGAQ